MAGVLLRGQHCRCRIWLPAGRFYLPRVYEMATAIYVAVVRSMWRWPRRPGAGGRPGPVRSAARSWGERERRAGGRCVGRVSGDRPLGNVGAGREAVVWTRLLSLVLGGTVYTFSLILAVFLIGLGIGSSLGAMLARRAVRGTGGAGRVPVAADRGHRLDGDHDLAVTSLLADRGRVVAQPVVHAPTRRGQCRLWTVLRRRACGERASRWRCAGGCVPRARRRAAGGRGLCCQHDRRDARRPAIQPGCGPLHGHGRRRAGVDRAGRGGRAGGAGTPVAASGPNGSPGRHGGAGGRAGSGRLARLDRDTGAVGARGIWPPDGKLSRPVGTGHRQCRGRPGQAWRARRLLHLRRGGDERVGCRHPHQGRCAELPRRR